MSRRSLSHRKPGTELPAGVPAARHRLSAMLGAPDGSGVGNGLLEPMPAADPVADQPDRTRPAATGDSPAAPGLGRAAPGHSPAAPGVRSRTGLRASALLGAVAAVLGGWFWWRAVTGAPEMVPLGDVSSVGVQQQNAGPRPESSQARDGTSSEPTRIIVHVAGAVVRPGVVELPAGSRLHEALTAAGGTTGSAEPDRLNLAAVVEDGQQIVVPERGQPEASSGEAAGSSGQAAGTGGSGSAGTGSAGPGGAAGGTRINLNTAGVEELGTLPRVGPVLAQRIVDWRKQHGRFQTVDELDAVDGVGPKLLETLLPLVRV
ncbi:competence protein ComEA [Arthrobacter sp. V4I6]|uniref:helix-hairpin-helix domain-containing protein n=1 Tax=unclassified Arthrobacter TaxID=235627 RepID=UPI002785E24A|nr:MULTISPECIES: helix-hairpin-helix domain-containing protein [unclassified Arthrobacter]MDQ0820936.1 competence protein ComEA [Arthrobacter sp. V1I7]MDQ0855197.1 competence protein ComEA [Arthrobacter sp. V4I6]